MSSPPTLPLSDDALNGVNEGRQQRVREMLARRLGSVAVVIEAVHRRHNTSAILRSCEAFGIHEVHLVTGGFRPSKGAARGAERWVALQTWDTTAEVLAHLRARGFGIWVADLAPQAHTPDSLPVGGPVALLFGNELSGVSEDATALADGAIIVPMFGLTESLNVSVAAACVLQRVTTRRREALGAAGDLSPATQQAFFEDWLASQREVLTGLAARVSLSGDDLDDFSGD